MNEKKRLQQQHKKPSYPIYDCSVNEVQRTGDFSNCTNFDIDSCSNNSSPETDNFLNCDEFEQSTRVQLIILFAISTSVSLLNLIALLIVYEKDPEIEEIPNFAERQRAFSAEFSQSYALFNMTVLLSNKSCCWPHAKLKSFKYTPLIREFD